MKAILLLGGFGTRLRPFTITTPKSLLPLVNIPFISYQLELLRKYGIKEVILAVGYKGEQFKKILDIGKKMGLKTYLSFEKTPLSTGGGIKKAEKFLKGEEPFFVFNGDVLADFNLEKILSFHKEKNAYITIGIVKVDNPSSYGLIITDSDMRIKKFIEKPKPEEIITDTINAGIYVFQPEVLEEIPKGIEVSIEKETFPQTLEKGKEIFGYLHYGYWLDIGTIEKYRKANFDIIDGKINLLYIPSDEKGENLKIDGKLIVGKNTIIKNNSEFKGNVIVGKNVFIGDRCFLKDTIIFDNVIIEDNCIIENCVIANSVILKKNCEIKNLALADKSFIYEFSKIYQ